MKQCILVCVIGANLFPCGLALADDKHVTVMATPGHGIQPQAVMDAHGNLHLLYFQGDAGSGNLQYVRRDAGETEFSKPLRVNSQQESAIATGTIRGGHLAVGKNDRVHVSWNGSSNTILQQTSDLTTTSWSAFSFQPVLTNGQYQAVFPLARMGSSFFRLKSP